MRKNLFGLLAGVCALLAVGLISCDSDADGEDDVVPQGAGVASVGINGISEEISASGQLTLTAAPVINGDVEIAAYTWVLTDADGGRTKLAASLNALTTPSVTLTADNQEQTEKTVKVKVRVTDSNGNVATSPEYTIKIAAKGAPVQNVVKSITITATNNAIAATGEPTTLTAVVTMQSGTADDLTYTWSVSGDTAAVTQGENGGETFVLVGKNAETTAKSVRVTVTAGGVTSSEPYVVSIDAAPATPGADPEKTGTVAISANVATVTVTFADADYEGKKDNVVVTLVQGSNSIAKIPAWTRDGYKLTGWKAEDDDVTTETPLTENVTFTAVWTKFYTVTFVDTVAGEGENAIAANETVTQEILESAETKKVTVPNWTKDDYKLAWTSSVTGLTVASDITQDVTFTAGWTARTVYTVTFKDADGGTNATVVKKFYADEDEAIRKATAPEWTKTHYTLSWNPVFNSDAVVSASATYTAVWTENAKYTVTYKDVAGGTNAETSEEVYEGETPAKVPTWTKDGYNLSWSSSVEGVETDSAITQDITFTAVWKEKEQWYGTLDLRQVTKSDKGTVLTSNFKSAETITETDDEGNVQVFSIATSSSNMQINTNGLKFQKEDTSLSFTTLSAAKIVIAVTIGSDGRNMKISCGDDYVIVIGRGTSGAMNFDKTKADDTVTAVKNSSVYTVTIPSAKAGTWKIESAAGTNAVQTTSIAISKLTSE